MRIKVPYTLNLLSPIIGWSILCATFAYVLILAIAKFEEPAAKQAFELMAPAFVVIFCFLAVLRYSGVGFWAGDDVRLINKNVVGKGIISGLTTIEIKETFKALEFIARSTMINVLASGLSVMVLVVLTVWINVASNFDLLIIILGGAIALFFSCAFATFFCQQSMFAVIKDCRRMLLERGEEVKSPNLSGISFKFYFLFFLPLFTVLIVLIASYPVSYNIIVVSLVGLIMTFVIDRVLFVYLANALREMERFADELPKGERAVFATGSLDREIVNLADNLNDASEEIYVSQKELKKSQEEMKKRVDELEKFFELTINREIKMVELKKELNKLKGNVQEDNA
ncbi:MAG: hypothetical protein WA091_01850 [Minisyncoccales bacterium]